MFDSILVFPVVLLCPCLICFFLKSEVWILLPKLYELIPCMLHIVIVNYFI